MIQRTCILPILAIGLIIAGVLGGYMVHVIWLLRLILILSLAVVLAVSTLVQINFLRELCIQCFVSCHLAKVIVS